MSAPHAVHTGTIEPIAFEALRGHGVL